jgi:hypothetical protein
MTHAQRLDFVFQIKEPVHSNRRGCQVSQLVEGFMLISSREGDYYPLHSPVSPKLRIDASPRPE